MAIFLNHVGTLNSWEGAKSIQRMSSQLPIGHVRDCNEVFLSSP